MELFWAPEFLHRGIFSYDSLYFMGRMMNGDLVVVVSRFLWGLNSVGSVFL